MLSCQLKSAYTFAVETRDLPELDLWRLWKQATETVRSRILEEVNCSSGLSDADLAVLFRVAESGEREIRQHELAESLRWHRSRLSHQLTRMEQRGLLRRKRGDGGVVVATTERGDDAFDTARPMFVAAVRKHFIALIPEKNEEAFRTVLRQLVEETL